MAGRNVSTIYPSGSIIRKFPFAPWRRLKQAIDWRQGDHVICVGATKSGKSTVAGEFLGRRRLVVVCVSKGMDAIFDGPYYRDFETIKRWPPPRSSLEKVLLRPANLKTNDETRKNKTAIFRHLFDDVLLRRGHWCIVIDEQHYMAEALGLKADIADLLEQGRSALISIWNNTQRPAGVPLATYVNSSHGFFFSSQEEYDVSRLGKMRNRHTNVKEMMANIEQLDSFNSHEHIYLDRTGKIPPVRSIVDVRRG